MISVLVLDDDPRKVDRIRSVIAAGFHESDYTFTACSTVHEGAGVLRQRTFDLLVLDLNVPLRSGEAPRPDGGVRLLREIVSRRDLFRPRHIVGLTAFRAFAADQQADFDREMWTLLEYDETSTDWEERFARKLTYIVDSSGPAGTYSCDLAIITALEQIELDAVLELDAAWLRTSLPGDDTFYHQGVFQRDGRSIRVVAACCAEMGMPAATAVSMKLISAFRPRFLAMAGIAAGVGGVSFGDILVADHSWDYGSGKIRSDEGTGSIFLPAPSQIQLSTYLKTRLSCFIREGSAHLQAIREAWRGSPPDHPLSARMGPVASGAAVLQNRSAVEQIVAHNRKVIGIEMETYGVFTAARFCSEPRPLAFSAKSVCDFADEAKGDDYQRYAAFTSARFIREFSLEHLTRPQPVWSSALVPSERLENAT
jgi:nucleoside phosphorylase/CheY-like chemotaxis protein